nr:MAG TPA: hypothetical protein [Caudoviricetes sp.]
MFSKNLQSKSLDFTSIFKFILDSKGYFISDNVEEKLRESLENLYDCMCYFSDYVDSLKRFINIKKLIKFNDNTENMVNSAPFYYSLKSNIVTSTMETLMIQSFSGMPNIEELNDKVSVFQSNTRDKDTRNVNNAIEVAELLDGNLEKVYDSSTPSELDKYRLPDLSRARTVNTKPFRVMDDNLNLDTYNYNDKSSSKLHLIQFMSDLVQDYKVLSRMIGVLNLRR